MLKRRGGRYWKHRNVGTGGWHVLEVVGCPPFERLWLVVESLSRAVSTRQSCYVEAKDGVACHA